MQKARHIEIQIIGDGQGLVLCLGERECSIQRRRQKLIEEAPAPNLSRSMRKELHPPPCAWANRCNTAGWARWNFCCTGKYYFIEVNPRIQVEHPVTEMVAGLDLVRAQLELAQTGQLRWRQDQIIPRGWGHRSPRAGRGPFAGLFAGNWARFSACKSRPDRAFGWTAPCFWGCK